MEQTGFSLSALKRHARRLAEAGVIAFQDSPNGKRWGRRDVDPQVRYHFYQCPALDWIAGDLFNLRESDVILFAGSRRAPILATSSETEINQYVVVVNVSAG